MSEFGRLRRRHPREVWHHEAQDLTPWLGENLSVLGEALGLELELGAIEAPVGDFSVDILAHDLGRDRPVVVENQLTPTDHDHLGKLITYASGYGAATVIWVAPEIRDEHRQALDWLNQHTDAETEFFGVVVEILQIDDSRPAVQIRPVAAPNTWRKEKLIRPGTETPRAKAYRSFFQGLIDALRETHRFTGARVAQPQSWYAFSSGTRGISYSSSFTGDSRCRAEVYLDTGDATETNKRNFDALLDDREELETAFGDELSWERLDEKRASRVAVYRAGANDASDEELQDIHHWFVERLLKLRQVLGPRLLELSR